MNLDQLGENVRHPEFIDAKTLAIDWLGALESLKKSTGIVDDKDFASYLNITPSNLSEMKRGRVDINARLKIKILEHLGFYRLASASFFLLQEDLANAARRSAQRRAKKISEMNQSKMEDKQP